LAQAHGVPLLLTRLAPEIFATLPPPAQASLNYDPSSRTAIVGPWRAPAGEPVLAVVTAGTSDLPVAREALRTLAFYGVPAREIADVGVAGLWRILKHEEELRRYPAVIVVAGMEGALFSVVGGLIAGVVIAVPTSTGYGVARGGETALHAALASCAPGVVTVNIDNGYGAACAAIRVLGAHARSEISAPA
jgi:pyridinium-3,5-biscarboxylic acid mononucleotide synthase